MDVWSEAELARFLTFIEGRSHVTAIYTAAMTGMRRGEVCAQLWRDVDLATGTLSIKGAVTPTASGLQIVEPSSARGRRVIELAPRDVAVLRRHRSEQLELRMLVADGWRDQG
jgi:integrase